MEAPFPAAVGGHIGRRRGQRVLHAQLQEQEDHPRDHRLRELGKVVGKEEESLWTLHLPTSNAVMIRVRLRLPAVPSLDFVQGDLVIHSANGNAETSHYIITIRA